MAVTDGQSQIYHVPLSPCISLEELSVLPLETFMTGIQGCVNSENYVCKIYIRISITRVLLKIFKYVPFPMLDKVFHVQEPHGE